MKLGGILFFLTFYISIVSSQDKAYNPEKLYTVQEMKTDLSFLKNALEEGHPGYSWYTPKDSLNFIISDIEITLQKPLNEKEFSRALEPLFRYVRCGHTIVLPSKDYYKLDRSKDRKFPPFNTFYDGNDVYLIGVRDDTSSTHVGKKISRINDKPVAQIVEDIINVNTTDGYNQTHQLNVLNRRFSSFFRFLYEETDSFNVELIDSLGNLESASFGHRIVLNKKNQKQEDKAKKKSKPSKQTKRGAKSKSIFKNKAHKLTLAEKDSSIAILDIRSFDRHGKKFYKKVFKYLNENKMEHLAIDLRNNGGGYVGDALFLLSYLIEKPIGLGAQRKSREKLSFKKNLSNRFAIFITNAVIPFFTKTIKEDGNKYYRIKIKPEKKYKFKGDVFVLINGGSFSASCIVGSYLDDQGLATFIGRETGGGKNGSSAILMPYLNLPKTGVRVRFPLYRVVHEIKADNIGRGIVPDHPIKYSIEDVLKKKDLDMEKVYELVNKKSDFTKN